MATAPPPPKKISLALGSTKKPPRSTTNGLKRPHSSLQDDEDDEAETRTQTVSHFDRQAGGAIDEKRVKTERGPLVIASQKNRDWKDASSRKRQRSALPGREGQDGGKEGGRDAAVEEAERREKEKTFGLNIMKRSEEATEDMSETMDVEAQPVSESEASAAPKTDDQLAMDALLGVTQKSSLVVPAVTETDAFQDDFRTAPDVATLDDYARVPVEEFGAAMLRGMGWKEGEGVGASKGTKASKTELPQRRPALLGIGAKGDTAVDAELGGWGKAARGKEVKIYNPVLLKDKKTGELVTEEELQKRREEAQRLVFEEEFERNEREVQARSKRGDDGRDRRRRDGRDDRRRDERDSDRRRNYKDDTRDDRHRHRRSSRERDDRKDGRRDERERRSEKERRERRRDDSEDEAYRRRKKETERPRRERERDGDSRDEHRERRRERR